MNPKLYLLFAALVLTHSGFSQMAQNALRVSDRDLPGATPRVEVTFKLYQEHLIVVQGSVGRLERLNFLIDTGVNPTAIDSRTAKKLRLASYETHKVALFNQNTDVREVVLPSIKLGPIRAESLPGVVQDLSPMENVLGIRVDAIVGLGVLGRSSFSIDYMAKKIVFGPVELSPSAVPFDTGPPVVTVPLRIEDEPVRLLVDTGAAELVLFECQLHGRLRRLPLRGGTPFRFNGTGNESAMTEVWLRGVHLGQTDFGLQKGLEAKSNAHCSQSFDGVVGIRALRLKSVAFDFEHRSLGWTR